MTEFLSLTIAGLVTGCVYSIAASGLVVTYTISGVFDFAHGAIGMIAAFVFWQLSQSWHLPTLLSLALVLLVLAPAFGAAVERLLIRNLAGSTSALAPAVTLGLMLFLVGLATTLWDPQTARSIPEFFSGHQVTILGTVVTWHQLITAGCAVGVAVGLRLFLFHTRPGVTMRATVDDPALVGLTGAAATRYTQFGWAIGASMAALAGVLLAPAVNLDVQTLTLLVVNAFAAAVLGRLRNLPFTFVGGLALGLVGSYAIGYLPLGNFLSELGPLIPMAFLFVVLIVLPDTRLSGAVRRISSPRVIGGRESVIAAGAFLAVASVVSVFLSTSSLETAGYAVALGIIILSFVPLVGYAGQLSLCQFTFAGIGGVVMSRFAGGGSWGGILLAGIVAGAAGVVVSLPVVRLRGLYLGLATLAFAEAMDAAFFNNSSVMGIEGAVKVGRVALGQISLAGNRAYFVFLCVVFALAGVAVSAVRRSRAGRFLIAMNDSERAVSTFGMNVTLIRVAVFGACAAFAGIGGALYGGEQHLVGPTDFQLLISLTALLIVTMMGVRTVTGALLAGVGLAVLPVIQSHISWLHDFTYLGVGLGALGIGANPNGAVGGRNPMSLLRARRAASGRRHEAEAALPGVAAASSGVEVRS